MRTLPILHDLLQFEAMLATASVFTHFAPLNTIDADPLQLMVMEAETLHKQASRPSSFNRPTIWIKTTSFFLNDEREL